MAVGALPRGGGLPLGAASAVPVIAAQAARASARVLKLLFMDAHLKVQDKMEIFDEYLQRRTNIVKAYIAMFNQKLEADADDLDIEPEVTPYMLTSEIDELNYWLTANGNKPVISQEESIEGAGISKNTAKTMEKLKEQSSLDNSFIIGEPVTDPIQGGKSGKGDDDDDEE